MLVAEVADASACDVIVSLQSEPSPVVVIESSRSRLLFSQQVWELDMEAVDCPYRDDVYEMFYSFFHVSLF